MVAFHHCDKKYLRGNLTPNHVAIIMDGNGRWGLKEKNSRLSGLEKGLHGVQNIVQYALEEQIRYLTLFAFSTENWKRPRSEVDFILSLFSKALDYNLSESKKMKVRFNFLGDSSCFDDEIQRKIKRLESETKDFTDMVLNIAFNYGGRWDICQAAKKIVADVSRGDVCLEDIGEDYFSSKMSLAGQEDIDLLIRTGGERRISNFALWNLSYSEIFFSDVCWPDFNKDNFKLALQDFSFRHRRFGTT